jgi:hypothetical protein
MFENTLIRYIGIVEFYINDMCRFKKKRKLDEFPIRRRFLTVWIQPCNLWLIEIIRTSIKAVICSKINPKFDGIPATDFLTTILNYVIIKICYAYLKELKPVGNKCI